MTKTNVTANIKSNRLYFKIIGKLTRKELDALYTDVRFCVADLKPGFDVITDLTECTVANLAGLPTFKKIANYLVTNNVGNVIRVLDENNLIFKQLINFAAKFQGYKSATVFSIEEAEHILSKSTQRDSIRLVLYQQSVQYNFEETRGTGTLIDISTSGCAIKASDSLPPVGQEMIVTLQFDTQDDDPDTFELPSKAVRVAEGAFAVTFLNLEEEQKNHLWKSLIRRTEQEVPA